MAVELANMAKLCGHEAGVLATRSFGTLESELETGVQRWSLQRERRWQIRARRLKQIIRDWRPTVLHVHGRSSMTFVAVAKALGILPQPAVFHDHNGRVDIDKAPKRLFAIGVQWACARYVGVSKAIADWAIVSGLSREKVSVIGNALNLDRIRRIPPVSIEQDLRAHLDRPVGIFVAGIRPEKGLLQLIHAAALLPRNASWSFLVVGGGWQTSYGKLCQAEVERQHLTKRFHCLGFRADTVGLAKTCDFAVIPSIYESGPLVLIEYLTCGLPVIASATGDVVHRARQVPAVRTVPAGDVAALARGLEEVIGMSESERRWLGSGAQEKTDELFDLRRVFGEWQTVYRQACGPAKGLV